MRKDPSNPRYVRVEVQSGSYNQRGYQNRGGRSDSRKIEDNMGTTDLDKTIETTIFKETPEGMEDKIIEKTIEIIGAMNITEAEIGQEKGHFQGAIVAIGIEVPVTVDQDQVLELLIIGRE